MNKSQWQESTNRVSDETGAIQRDNSVDYLEQIEIPNLSDNSNQNLPFFCDTQKRPT